MVVNIPLGQVPLGVTNVGPGAVDPGDGWIEIRLNRNVGAKPLDQEPATTQARAQLQISLDGGATWGDGFTPGAFVSQQTFTGGMHIDQDTGIELTTDSLFTFLPGIGQPGRQVRAIVTVSGARYTTSGTLTTGV